ncbi:MAG: stage II sporulation protein M [Candidatus Woesearchaeota archaeon]
MILDVFINPLSAERRPWQMFFLGIIFFSLAIILSLVVFTKQASLVTVFLTVLASFPIIYNTVKLEERKDEDIVGEKALLKEHSKALEVFMFLFLGVMVSAILWYIFLPSGHIQNVFSTQIETISSINSTPIGHITFSNNALSVIFLNNLRVLSICILFSFLYGVGAMFILTWNATVIAAAVGIFVRENLANIGQQIGSVSIWNYFHLFSVGILKYMIHGVFEIMAYFVAALAGGIISVAIIRHIMGTEKFERIIFDASGLIIISVILLFISALIEVFITPKFF